jgi:AbrB family looped-hinge helix DNA binding protein
MSTRIRIQDGGQISLPARLRAQAGLKKGDLVEAAFEGGRILLTPKPASSSSKSQSAARLAVETQRDFAASLRQGATDLGAKPPTWQLVIPRDLWDELQLQEGDFVAFARPQNEGAAKPKRAAPRTPRGHSPKKA